MRDARRARVAESGRAAGRDRARIQPHPEWRHAAQLPPHRACLRHHRRLAFRGGDALASRRQRRRGEATYHRGFARQEQGQGRRAAAAPRHLRPHRHCAVARRHDRHFLRAACAVRRLARARVPGGRGVGAVHAQSRGARERAPAHVSGGRGGLRALVPRLAGRCLAHALRLYGRIPL